MRSESTAASPTALKNGYALRPGAGATIRPMANGHRQGRIVQSCRRIEATRATGKRNSRDPNGRTPSTRRRSLQIMTPSVTESPTRT